MSAIPKDNINDKNNKRFFVPPQYSKTDKRDRDLVERVKLGDQEALNILSRKYMLITRKMANKEFSEFDREDVMQEVMLKFIVAVYSYKSFGSFYRFFCGIYSNATKSWIKKNYRLARNVGIAKWMRIEREDNYPFVQKEDESLFIDALTIKEHMKNITKENARAVMMYYFDDIAPKQANELFGIPKDCYRGRYRRGITEIKKSIERAKMFEIKKDTL